MGSKVVQARAEQKQRWVSLDGQLLIKKGVFSVPELKKELKALNEELSTEFAVKPIPNDKGKINKGEIIHAVIAARHKLINGDGPSLTGDPEWAAKRIQTIEGAETSNAPTKSYQERLNDEYKLPHFNLALATNDPALSFAAVKHRIRVTKPGNQDDNAAAVVAAAGCCCCCNGL